MFIKKLFPLILTLLIVACGSAPKKDDYTLYKNTTKAINIKEYNINVSLLAEKRVDFRGCYDSNNSVDHANILYSGDAGAVGFLAQILTVSAISSSRQNARLSKGQIEANKVLIPFQKILENFTQNHLTHEDFRYTFNFKTSKQLNIKSKPIFFLSQDKRKIILKHVVEVKIANKKKPIYQNLIEYISDDISDPNAELYISSNNGENLKRISKEIYVKSLAILLDDIQGVYSIHQTPFKNYRFYEGKSLRIERGQKLNQSIERDLIRNLRGWLISFSNNSQKNT